MSESKRLTFDGCEFEIESDSFPGSLEDARFQNCRFRFVAPESDDDE